MKLSKLKLMSIILFALIWNFSSIAYARDQVALTSGINNLDSQENEFILAATTKGIVLENGLAKAYIKHKANSLNCLSGNNVLACRIIGPVEVLLAYQHNSSYFKIRANEASLCVVSEKQLFCDQP